MIQRSSFMSRNAIGAFVSWRRALILTAIALIATPALLAQVLSLYFREVSRDGNIYLFNSSAQYRKFQENGDMGKTPVTLTGYGSAGETVIAENTTAVDLYNLKHDREPRETTFSSAAPAPAQPASLKAVDGELKFGLLLQGWYVADDSPVNASTTSFYGNTTGLNTFRIRRAEIKVHGRITPAWGFEVMLDPAKSINAAAGADGKILQDLAITFLGLKGHEISLGQRKIALTEEGLRSSSELDFSERAQMTRTFSDRREAGLFYKSDWGGHASAFVSLTNGTTANVVDDSNDTLFAAARLDLKPVRGLIIGASGGTSGGEGSARLARERYAAHVSYEATTLPIVVRAEYLRATDGRNAASDLERDGFYGTLLYTFDKQYRLGIRYDEIDRNKDLEGDRTKSLTVGFHYLIKGKNVNLKADYFHVREEGRRIGGNLEQSYNQFVLAAQAAF